MSQLSERAVDAEVKRIVTQLIPWIGLTPTLGQLDAALEIWQYKHRLTPEVRDSVLEVFEGFSAETHTYLEALEDIGPVMRELREGRGWSLETAARHAGVSAAWIGSIERGDRDPHTPRLLKVLRAYGYRLEVVPV